MALDSQKSSGTDPGHCFTREDVFQHRTREDCWIILHGEVYNVTSWLEKHPGGAQQLLNHAGEDASVAWTSFHRNKKLVSKYMTTYHIGSLIEEQKELPLITKDFLKLREELEAKGMFKANRLFFMAMIVHALLLEAVAWFLLYYYGNTWSTWITSGILHGIAQVQYGALQHDLFHYTIFNNTKVSNLFHDIDLGLLQGVPINWWDGRHFLHHAKPNVVHKDPDVTMPFNFFLLGKTMPREWGEKHWGKFPYHLQHLYFIVTAPTFGVTIFYQVEFIIYALRRGLWKHLLWMCSFFLRFYLMYSALLGGFLRSLCWFFFVRFVESNLYVWVTQVNHLTMDIEPDRHLDWVTMQLRGTCDIKPSAFMDWFSGHLNYQIEHHLFPTMPRSSFKYVQPSVKKFCQDHGVAYEEKELWQGICDILRCLKHSGTLWAEAWKGQSYKTE